MARSRRVNYYTPNWKEGLTAAEINQRDGQGNILHPDPALDYNRRAEQVTLAMREANGGGGSFPTLHAKMLSTGEDDLVAAKKFQHQRDYNALAGALGVNVAPVKDIWDEETQSYSRPAQPPSFDALKAGLASLPAAEQAKIFGKQLASRGRANFMDPEAGMKLVQGLQKTREDSMNTGIQAMVSQLARGDVIHDPADGLFYRTVTESDPITQISKKTKVKLTPLEAKYLYEGRERGMIPDWSGFAAPAPALGAVDPAAAAVANSVAAKQVDPYTATHDLIQSGDASRYVGDLVGDIGTTIADTASAIPNAFNTARNAVGRLMFGNEAYQRPLVPKLSAQRPSDPLWVASQAETQRRLAEETARNYAAPLALGF